MKWLWGLVVVLLIVSGVQAQDEVKNLALHGPWRLNTVASDLGMKPGDLRIAHNLDFGANLDAWTIRRGYDSVSTITGMDSILGIYGAYYSDGTQQLFIVADSNGTGYGNVYVTQKGSVEINDRDSLTRIWQYWGVQNRPSFTMSDDNVYIVNGQQNGIIWNGTVAKTWPPRIPGEPLIVPLDDVGNLDGEYIYRFATNGFGVSTLYFAGIADGTISSRIKVSNGQVFLSEFPEPVYDSIGSVRRWAAKVAVNTLSDNTDYWVLVGDDSAGITSDGDATFSEITDSLVAHFTSDGVDSCTAIDFGHDSLFVVKGDFDYGEHGGISVSANLDLAVDTAHEYRIYRTNANPGRIEETDSVDLVKTFDVHYTDSAFYTDSNFTDNVSDGTLDVPLYSTNLYGRDSLGAIIIRYGAPGYVSMVDTGQVYDTVGDTLGNEWGIFYGIPTQKDTLGVMYGCTFIDTNTGIESALGPASAVFNDKGNEAYSYTVSLPNIPNSDSQLVINLYRAHILQVTYDSAEWKQSDTVTTSGVGPGVVYGEVKDHWVSVLAVDTVVVDEYYLVGQYPRTDSQVTDSIRFDSLSTRHRYARTTPPQLLTDVFSWDNRLWGIGGSNVWPSKIVGSPIDTLQEWMQANPIPINPDDGDQITRAFPSNRGLIRVFKYLSNYNIFQTSNLNWTRVEVSGTHGMIAPNSYARGFSGHYYLSASGVVRETEGQTIDRTQSIELISAPIKSFDNMSLIDKSKAVGFYDDRKYMLYIPAAGTTYVYDERASEHAGYPMWSTWDLVFQGATKYGVESELGFFPGDTMYYFNDSTLYLLGTNVAFNLDVTPDPVVVTWQTGPLFPDGGRQSIEKIGAWIRQDAGNYYAKIAVTNESGTVSDSILFDRTSGAARYEVKSIGANNGVFLLLGGTNQVAIANTTPSIIDGIDIWYTDEGPVIVE